MRVYACQTDIAWEDKALNFDHVRGIVRDLRPEPGSLLVLPEMFATGFSMRVVQIADGSGETAKFLGELAEQHRIWTIAGLVVIGPDGSGRNQALIHSPIGEEVARYTKIHPFTFGEESKHYGRGLRTVQVNAGPVRVSPFICYDLRFPEVFRTAVRNGVHLFAVIANWPAAREDHWVTLLRARAIENQAYVVGVNRCGNDPRLSYSGRSLIVDPRGQVLADAGSKQSVISAWIDLPALEQYRQQFPALADIQEQYVRAEP